MSEPIAAPADQAGDILTFSIVARDKPGVLVRIALVFARRGFNIESLAVSPGAIAGFARMTITSRGHARVLEQIIKHLAKLIDLEKIRPLRARASALEDLTSPQTELLEKMTARNFVTVP